MLLSVSGRSAPSYATNLISSSAQTNWIANGMFPGNVVCEQIWPRLRKNVWNLWITGGLRKEDGSSTLAAVILGARKTRRESSTVAFLDKVKHPVKIPWNFSLYLVKGRTGSIYLAFLNRFRILGIVLYNYSHKVNAKAFKDTDLVNRGKLSKP